MRMKITKEKEREREKLIKEETKRGIRRMLHFYAQRGDRTLGIVPEKQIYSLEAETPMDNKSEPLESQCKALFYHTGVEDSYANTLLFTDANTLSYDEIIFAANSFLPREVCVPFYTLTFVASETTEGCPQNSELGLAISRLCSSSIAKKHPLCTKSRNPSN